MQANQFKVGIALAVYNPQISYLKEQIQSLCDQTHQNWICFVSDDSTDQNLREKIQDLLTVDARFKYSQNLGDRGVFRNFENALAQLGAQFDFYCFCDQDDIWEKEKVEKLISHLRQRAGAFLAHSDLSLIDEDGRPIAPSCWAVERRQLSRDQSLLDLVIRNSVTGCSLMFAKGLYEFALPFPKRVQGEYLHDHWVAVIARAFGDIISVQESLIRYRQHGHNVIGASQQSSSKLSSKLRRIPQFKKKSQNSVRIRQKLASDLVDRVQQIDSNRAVGVEVSLAPILKPSPRYFIKRLVATKGKWPNFGLFLQLFAGSFFKTRDK